MSAAVDIPVIGMGGIASGRDAADFMAAGAAVIAVGTESFRDPAAGRRIGAELAAIGATDDPKWSRNQCDDARDRARRSRKLRKSACKNPGNRQVRSTSLNLRSRSS